MNGPLDIHQKVVGMTAAGAGALIIVWILSLAHVQTPDMVEAAFTLLLSLAGGYLAPIRPGPPPT
ncbi:MAG: hypothetical protein ACJ76I_11930 [Gaiellaceae bacterium]